MLIIDSFAGAGGASTGIHMATGRSPDIAINHDEMALGLHAANHPDTIHVVDSVWSMDPEDYTQGKPVGLLWASPDCRDHSKAKGGAPVSDSVRGLGWSVPKFVRQLRRNKPRVVVVENVEEFQDWGPTIIVDGRRCRDPARKGETFKAWCSAMRKLGYKVENRILKACDYGAPTIRKRLFVIMRCDGLPIVWPKPTHGKRDSIDVLSGKLLPWVPAHSVIDFSLPCPSIFDTAAQIKEKHGLRAIRPLADNTMRRIAAGVKRYILDAKEPFFISYAQHGGANRSANDPMHTITASKKDQNVIVVPHLVNVAHGGDDVRSQDLSNPVHTITGKNNQALVTAFMAQHNTQRDGVHPGRSMNDPLATITTRPTQTNVVACNLTQFYSSNKGNGGDLNEPTATVSASGQHTALVSAFMVKYYGVGIGQSMRDPVHSITTKDRFGLVTVMINGVDYVVTDIGMRMLSPRELFNAQGFPPEYIIDRQANGKSIGKTKSVHGCGNSVPPDVVAAIIDENCTFMKTERRAA